MLPMFIGGSQTFSDSQGHDRRLVKPFCGQVRAGTVWTNDPLTDNYARPFGGMNMSGLGRELGQEGLDEFLQVKRIRRDMVGAKKPYQYPYGEGEA